MNNGGLIRQRSLYFMATSKTDEQFSDAVEEARFLMRSRRKLGAERKRQLRHRDARRDHRIARSNFRHNLYRRDRGSRHRADRRRDRDHEHHAGVGDGANQGDRNYENRCGARQIDILKQFLVEAVTLAAIGGAVGIFWPGSSGKL